MTEYEIIDAICDSVNPILFFVAIGVGVSWVSKSKFQDAKLVFGFLIGGLLMVYGIQFLDSKFSIWRFFGGDYSTHTAFAIAASVSISVGTQWAKWLALLVTIYAVAMLYQKYHSIFDIASTAVIIGTPLVLMKKSTNLFQRT